MPSGAPLWTPDIIHKNVSDVLQEQGLGPSEGGGEDDPRVARAVPSWRVRRVRIRVGGRGYVHRFWYPRMMAQTGEYPALPFGNVGTLPEAMRAFYKEMHPRSYPNTPLGHYELDGLGNPRTGPLNDYDAIK